MLAIVAVAVIVVSSCITAMIPVAPPPLAIKSVTFPFVVTVTVFMAVPVLAISNYFLTQLDLLK